MGQLLGSQHMIFLALSMKPVATLFSTFRDVQIHLLLFLLTQNNLQVSWSMGFLYLTFIAFVPPSFSDTNYRDPAPVNDVSKIFYRTSYRRRTPQNMTIRHHLPLYTLCGQVFAQHGLKYGARHQVHLGRIK